MANKKKYYAVKEGRRIGIFDTWEECKEQIDRYSNAVYKSFATIEEAKAFILGKAEEPPCENYAYVDGSYMHPKREFSFGAVIFADGKREEYYKKFSDPSLAEMRNVAGEIKGAEFVMRYCVEKGIGEIDLFYDYAGIEKWCTGEWKANKVGTKEYRDYYLSIKDKLKVNFRKVKGHSGVEFNELADKLAKQALTE